ncbi:Lysosome-associated membrane glycoprotein 1 [Branchiostoma belcheri]|nr:Lysosome-associated membrane glycoprotein 1 [Branchiostoma belcheri]
MTYPPIVAVGLVVLCLCCSVPVGGEERAGTPPEVGHYAVKNKRGETCFLADLAATFRIRYVKTDNTTEAAEYVLPCNCSVAYESTCPNRLDGENQAVLLLHVPWDWDFGLYLRFSREKLVMEHFWLAETVVYYRQDPSLFPDAKFPNHFFSPFLNNLREMETRSGFFRRRSFLCESGLTVFNLTFPYFDEAPGVHPNADLIFDYIHVQPFDVRDDKFAKAERCAGDHHTSTPSPVTTPPAVTSEIPLANASTIPTVPSNVTVGPASTLGPTNGSFTLQPASSVAPGNHTTPASTTVPFTSTAPPTVPPEPLQGRYVLKNATGDVCLLAYMALQFDIAYAKLGHRHGIGVFNVPTDAVTSGFCDKTVSNITLSFYGGTFDLTLSFQMVDGGRFFHLSSVDLHYVEVPGIFPQTETPNAKRSASNVTLDMFRASSGKSYRCSEDRDFVLTKSVTLHTRQVHVQAFRVNKGQFSTAQDCGKKRSSNNELVAVVTGGSLGGVIIIAIVTYFVCTRGRGTTRDGYTAIN